MKEYYRKYLSSNTKKLIAIASASFIVPTWVFIVILLSNLPRIYYTGIITHSLLLLVICSTAWSICYFYYAHYEETKDIVSFVTALAFGILGVAFFFHAITIPSFYFLNEDIFDLTEHLGQFFAGLIFSLFLPLTTLAPRMIYRKRKSILFVGMTVVALGFTVLTLSSELAAEVLAFIDLLSALGGVLLIVGIAILIGKNNIALRHASFPYLIIGLSMLATTAVYPFFYREWNIVWWYFHIVIFCAELVIFIGILKKCNDIHDTIA